MSTSHNLAKKCMEAIVSAADAYDRPGQCKKVKVTIEEVE